jgi:GNAT superfamily N-acetyltransferase
MTVRPAVHDDAKVIAEIWHAGWRDAHVGHVAEDLLAERTAAAFEVRAPGRVGDASVAVIDGAVAGFVVVVDDEVEQVYVAAHYRGSGVAAALLAEAERRVRANGHERAWLAVVPGNARARRFYERNGWADEGPFEYGATSARGRIAVACRRYVKRVKRVSAR